MAKTTPLKAIRQQKGLNQKQVAEQLGISIQYYNEIENGLRPSFKLALKLADFFQVSVDELFRDV